MQYILRLTLISFIIVQFCFSAAAQSGSITGKISDAANGEPLTGATVFLKSDSSVGTISDIDGYYTLENINAGMYDLVVRYVSYQTKIIAGVNVIASQATDVNIVLNSLATSLGTFTVTATPLEENINSLMVMQKNNGSVSNGISSDILKKTPSRNTADALKLISGTTIQENKFAIVRGLSDRYNSSMLNGSPLPSTEPDRKTFAFDLIPSSLIDNIILVKTAQPDLPGDFAGGLIQINTRDIPEKNSLAFSFGSAYYNGSTFQPYTSYTPGKKDWLGIDDGTRAIPSLFPSTEIYQSETDRDLQVEQSKLFANDWAPISKSSALPAMNFQLSGGIKTKIADHDFGGIFAVTYSNNLKFTNIFRGEYNTDTSSVFAYHDNQYKNNVLWGVIANASYKLNENNKITLKNTFNLNTDNTTTVRNGSHFERLQLVKSYSYNFVSNQLINSQLSGEHFLPDSKVKIKWNTGIAKTWRNEPDLRKIYYYRNMFPNDEADTIYQIYVPVGSASPEYGGKFYSNLNETLKNASIDFELPFSAFKQNQKFKFGMFNQWKNRTFDARVLGYIINDVAKFYSQNPNAAQILMMGPDSVFGAQNIGIDAFRIDDITNKSDQYTASSTLHAFYMMFDNKLSGKIRLIWGGRAEMFNQNLNSFNYSLDTINVHTTSADANALPFDFLPSANFIYSPTDKVNIRLSASRTLSRPEFRELAPFAFYDFTTSSTIVGNDSLTRTNIYNYDFRIEKFFGKGQVVSGSVYYKKFTDPVEQIVDVGSGAGSRIRTFENVPIANNYGVEFELRKNFDFIGHVISWKQWENFVFATNLSYIKSVVQLGAFSSGSDTTRPLQGQSPYIVNLSLLYNEPNSGWSGSIFFNEFGKRINLVGSSEYPDIYQKPRPVIDAQLSKKIFNDGLIKLTVGDLLSKDDILYQDQDHNGKYNAAADTEIMKVNYGTSISLALNYTF